MEVVLDVQNFVEAVDRLEVEKVVAARRELVDEEEKMVMTIEDLEAVQRHVRGAGSSQYRCRQELVAAVLDCRRPNLEERTKWVDQRVDR